MGIFLLALSRPSANGLEQRYVCRTWPTDADNTDAFVRGNRVFDADRNVNRAPGMKGQTFPVREFVNSALAFQDEDSVFGYA